MYEVQNWKHVFKLNPSKNISDENLELLCESKSDAIIISGTEEVDLEDVLDLMQRVRRFAIPCVLELSSLKNMSPGFDLYFIPTVLNSTNTKEQKSFHFEFIKEYGDFIHWDEVYMEGCCIVTNNSNSNTTKDLTEEDIISYAQLSEKMYRLPIFYLENQEELMNTDRLKNMKETFMSSTLFYSGNIIDHTTALQASLIADCIVVEDIIYENIKKALETVNAVK